MITNVVVALKWGHPIYQETACVPIREVAFALVRRRCKCIDISGKDIALLERMDSVENGH